MPMQHEGFVALILTHGRPDRVYTHRTLRRAGYTGRIVVLIDNEDRTADEYRERYGDEVVQFDKAAVAARIDEGDNFRDRRAIIYARNASFDVAQQLGARWFMQLDDDYTGFVHKRGDDGEYSERRVRDLDAVLDAMIDYYETTPVLAIAMSQNGDFPGGARCTSRDKPSRKAMNSFLCSTRRPFQFVGRINEDVNTYTSLGARGGLFITTKDVALQQKQTQSNAGGMTELYLDAGTYVKTFYSVMYQPSSVQVSVLPSRHSRIHHKVRWRHTVPCIVPEEFRRAG